MVCMLYKIRSQEIHIIQLNWSMRQKRRVSFPLSTTTIDWNNMSSTWHKTITCLFIYFTLFTYLLLNLVLSYTKSWLYRGMCCCARFQGLSHTVYSRYSLVQTQECDTGSVSFSVEDDYELLLGTSWSSRTAKEWMVSIN